MKRLILVLALLAAPAWAVQPDEVLDDPALEDRARDLSAGLRCPVCQNESIDESNAGISRDLRILLRERLVAGDSDEEAVQFLVDRYGEYILLSPPKSGANLVLWLAAPVLLLIAAGVGYDSIRSRSRAKAPEDLSEEEKARLDEIMRS
ncbi:MAG: cytochrome C biogenesis protein CcdA [Alphaproteobacteria bacterium]|jgi:cytochrome c-type biogenesis protein CcmH|nr:cytochrome C biogenesis protein CcdA [Alphaproteobacteria bacterium]